MTDRGKAIKGLECCQNQYSKCYKGMCPYFANEGCKARLKADVLSLLKAQEPVKPVIKQEMDDIFSCVDNVAYCGKCGAPIGRLKQNYCSNCGQAVKWDD